MVRQKFTGYERDGETELDFAQARYFASAQGRFTSPDSYLGMLGIPQSLNLYSYVLNNPLRLVDPTGHIPEEYILRSTHTDNDGNVVAVYNDGDYGVYKHTDLMGWDGKRKLPTSGPGVILMGGTLHWDEFAYLDEKGNPVEGAQTDKKKRGKILFDESWDETMEQIHNQQNERGDPYAVAQMSRNGFPFDIKARPDLAPHGNFTGKKVTLLYKKYNPTYMSAKSIGNFMVGHYGGFMGVTLHVVMNLAGALQQKQWRGGRAAADIMAGKEFGPAPYYGETAYAGRMIQLGYGYGLMRRNRRGRW